MQKNIGQRLILLLTLFVFSSISLYGQNTVTISGTALDEVLGEPVESATVYLHTTKDSTLVDYSITDKLGNFKLTLKKIDEPVEFIITDEMLNEFRVEWDNLLEDKSLGEVKLGTVVNLEGVVITGAPPIRIKTDTLEFNAASFKVRPDANVETLLKQLPGVEIDEEGKITVNGKEVNQILVNGKPFFDKDGKVALQNLPASLINKVQVTDTKTKKEELAGEKAKGNNASINFTIDEDKNKGVMLKAMAGYGTEDRYESSLLVNYFKGDMKLSVLASSNNINSTGFSMDEIFDNMGGGRNRTMWSSESGGFGVNGMNFGGGNGIITSNMTGINYSDTFAKDIDFRGSYFFQDNDAKNRNYSKRQNLLPNNTYTTESTSIIRNQSQTHRFTTSVEVKIDSTSTFVFEPNYSYSKRRTSDNFSQNTINDSRDLLNESYGFKNGENTTQNFSSSINYDKSFRNKMGLSVYLDVKNDRAHAENLNNSITKFYQSGDNDDVRNQLLNSRNNSDNFDINLEWRIPISDSAKINLGIDYTKNKNKNDQLALDFDEFTGQHTAQNDLLTTFTSSDYSSLNPNVGLQITKSKFWFSAYAGYQNFNQESFGRYLGTDYLLDQKFEDYTASLNFNYRFTKNLSLYFNYSKNNSLPSSQQLLPILNLSDPLNTFIGNPDLEMNKTHNFYVGLNNFNMQSKLGININLGANYNESSVTNFRTINEDFVSNTTYVNVEGNYWMWGSLNVNKSFTSGRSKFRVGLGTSLNYAYNQGFIDGEKYISKSKYITPRINFNWDFADYLTVNPSYNVRFQINDYENYRIDHSSNYVHTFKLTTTSYWPKSIVFGNDLSYTYNSNIADGFKKDFLLWNTSLAYNFYKDQFTFKVKVYDVLGQNTGDRRTITDTFISDIQNDVLQRYVMFSLSYKFDQFGGSKNKRERGSSRFNFY